MKERVSERERKRNKKKERKKKQNGASNSNVTTATRQCEKRLLIEVNIYLLIIQEYLNKPEETKAGYTFTQLLQSLTCTHIQINSLRAYTHTTSIHDIYRNNYPHIHTCVVCYTRKWQQLFNRKLIEKNKN